MMRKAWVGLAVLAVAAVVGLYLAGSGANDRAAATRHTAETPSAEPEATPPGAPPVPAAKTAHVFVHDADRKPVPGATVGIFKDGKLEGDTVKTGADGKCALPVPGDVWYPIVVRHPDYVQARTYVRARDPEREVELRRGAPLTVLVLDPVGKAVPGAELDVSWEQTHGSAGIWRWSNVEELGAFTTGEDGRAAIGEVPQSTTIVVKVDKAPYALVESRVEIPNDDPVEHVVRLDSGGILVGRVVGPGGEGVPGATVSCRRLARPIAESGPSGDFRLEGVPAGSVEVVAKAEGYGPGFFGGSLGWGDPVPIPLRSGETLNGIDIVLSKPVFVVGRIVDEEKQPVKDVAVYTGIQHGFSLGSQVKSDEDGKFRAGPYSLQEQGRVWAWFSAPEHAIDLGEIKATRRASVKGVLVDEAGNPVEASLTADWGNGFGVSASDTSKPDGTFDLGSVGPGKVTLVANRTDEPKLRSRPVELETVSGQAIEGVRIVLLKAKSIRGRVITPDGGPRPGATVGVKAETGGAVLDTEWTDKDGKFEFADLAEGEYEVGIFGKGSAWGNQERAFLDNPPSVKVPAGRDDLEFIFPLKGGILTGKVVAKRDGRPIKQFGATFLRYKFFIPTDTDYESYQDEGGEFRYEADEPGTWQVDIAATGYAAHRTDRFSLGAGEVKDVGTIKLGPGGTIAGRVLDAQKQPVPYTRVNILNDKLQTNDDEPYTDLDGRFEVPGVSPGIFTVFAVSPRHPLGMVRGVTVKEGERTDVEITFVEAAPLTVEVRSTSGQPVEGAQLDFTFPAVAPLTSRLFRSKIPPGYGSYKSDAQGTIVQPCLPPGEVTIMIEAGGYDPVTRKLDLKPGEANRIELQLRPKATGTSPPEDDSD
jgi:hypothetical protein